VTIYVVAIIWSIWNQRNNVNFRNEKVDVETIAQVKTWSWIENKYQKATFSYPN